MTLFGSIIMLIIGFVVGYLVSGATRGANARDDRQVRNQETVVRQRPVPSHTFSTETGTIGESHDEAQGQQQQYAQKAGPAKPAYSSAQVFVTEQPRGQNQQGQSQAQNVNMQGAQQQADQQAAIQATPQNTQQTTAQSMTAANQQYQTEVGGSLGTQGQMSQASPAKNASDSAHVFMNTESGPTNQKNQNQGPSQQ